MGDKEISSKKYKLVPPDGGWGYMIAAAVTVNLITIATFLTSFGMIYKYLFIQLDMDSTSITLLNGINSFVFAISGLVTTPLLSVLSIRQLGLIAAILHNIGTICIVFVNSKITFFICFGFLQSLGHGLIFNLSCTMLNNYFEKRRLLAVSITQTAVGFASLLSPQFVKWTLETYAFKGTIILISGVSLQNIVAMALMQPVEWHMKKVEVPVSKKNEMKSLLLYQEKPLNEDENKTSNKTSACKNNIDTTVEKCNTEEEEKQYWGIMKVLNTLIDLTIIKSFLLSNACFGTALCVSTEFIFIALFPQALYSMKWNEADVAWVLSLNAMADLITRALFILLSNLLLKVGSHQIYVIGLVFSLITRLGMLWSENKTVITVFITLMGIPRCIIMMLLQVVIADSVHQTKFSSAMGIVMSLFGFFNIVFGPIVGAIRDLTNSYSVAFYVLSSCFALIIITWTIELVHKKNKHKRSIKEDSSKA